VPFPWERRRAAGQTFPRERPRPLLILSSSRELFRGDMDHNHRAVLTGPVLGRGGEKAASNVQQCVGRAVVGFVVGGCALTCSPLLGSSAELIIRGGDRGDQQRGLFGGQADAEVDHAVVTATPAHPSLLLLAQPRALAPARKAEIIRAS
jgi:hypothetical protein